ncbi:MAG: RNA 2',3'-cyclic phosphodiesterase [Armatimonadetes bacterium]|nr:RNA 2',3'-cyclic phosphodiesterase [Armatimonadota bacterium]
MESVRTFVAVLISEDLKRRIALIQEEFKKVAPEVKWVGEGNFHITVKFLGNVEREKLDRIAGALSDALSGLEPFEVEIGGAGAFPSATRPRVVWVGVTSGAEQLRDVASRVENGLGKLGLPPEDKSFKAHITIGRVKDGRRVEGLDKALKTAEVGDLGSAQVDSVALMKSDLRREGPVYSVISEVRLLKNG